MARTKIEWTDMTWNPVTGCTPISEACQNCYAKRMSKRLAGRCGYPEDEPFKVTLHPERLDEPFKWRKPRRVFVCSMSDLFHEKVDEGFLCRIFDTMLAAEQHTYLILTKRPERMKDFITRCIHGIPKNIWLGVTAENQQRAEERIPILLQIPAAVRFVSVEPMLGPLDIYRWLRCHICSNNGSYYNPNSDEVEECHICSSEDPSLLDWIICGGETGPGARPVHPDWVRSLRDQCQDSEVHFFFKQHGEWLHETQGIDFHEGHKYYVWHDESMSFRVGKKAAGRILDGRTWDEMPEI